MSIDAQHAAGLRAGLLGQLMAEHHTTISVIEHVPEDKLSFRVHPHLRTFAELAHHIYFSGIWVVSFLETGAMGPGDEGTPVPSAKAELISRCEAMNRDVSNRINAFTPGFLAQIVDLPGFGPFPAVAYLGLIINHLVHHRGQLTIYLRLMGAKVPRIYGGTLDYP
jgi:uncharacterized damage-inducible protein DinB